MAHTKIGQHDMRPLNDQQFDGSGRELQVCLGCGLQMSAETAANTYKKFPCTEDGIVVEIHDHVGWYVQTVDRSWAMVFKETKRLSAQADKRAEQREEERAWRAESAAA